MIDVNYSFELCFVSCGEWIGGFVYIYIRDKYEKIYMIIESIDLLKVLGG